MSEKRDGLKQLYDYCKFQYQLVWLNISDSKKFFSIVIGPALIFLGISVNFFLPLSENLIVLVFSVLVFGSLFLSIVFALFGLKPASYKFPASPQEIYEVFEKEQNDVTDAMLKKFIKTLGGSVQHNLPKVKNSWKHLQAAYFFLCLAIILFFVTQGLNVYRDHNKKEGKIMCEDKGQVKKEIEKDVEKKFDKIPDELMTASDHSKEKGGSGGNGDTDEDSDFDDIPDEEVTKGN